MKLVTSIVCGVPAVASSSCAHATRGAWLTAELVRCETPEVETFRRLHAQADPEPEVLATDQWELEQP